ncbi:MAG TPA: AgmX/PglI C-terminal domain-containing protein, partial [Sorangium sp.]|nr:AgmX/PglI C-terminal domain-containing protein [Sorangium sp.]
GRPSAGGIGGVGGAGGATTGGSRPRTTRRGGGAERTDRLTKGTIRRVVRRAVAQFRRCYERALTTQPTLKGTVLSSFVIGTTGLVESVTFRSSTLKSSATERCIKGVFARLQFPKPDHGGVVRVRYPLTFSPTGSGTKASAGTGQTKAAAAAAAAPNTARVKQTSP